MIAFADVCRHLQFFSPVAGKALVGHVFETMQVETGDQCEIRCYRDHKCLSVNLGPYQVNGHVCELSKSDHVRNPDDLVPTPGYIYKGTEVMRYSGSKPWLWLLPNFV